MLWSTIPFHASWEHSGLGCRRRLIRLIHCLDCIVELTTGLMTAHRRCMYGTERGITWKYLTSVSQRARLSAHAPFLDAWIPRGPGTACWTILTNSTEGTVSGSWRSTPPCFPDTRGLGVRYHNGALGTVIMSLKMTARGATPDQTEGVTTLIWGQPVRY